MSEKKQVTSKVRDRYFCVAMHVDIDSDGHLTLRRHPVCSLTQVRSGQTRANLQINIYVQKAQVSNSTFLEIPDISIVFFHDLTSTLLTVWISP